MVEYSNLYAEGNGDQGYTVDGLIVGITKGIGRLPESLTAVLWGNIYQVDVQEDETGAICVPWYEGA